MWQAVAPFPDVGRSPIDVIDSGDIRELIPEIKTVKHGILNVFVRGSGAALSVNENCDPTVRSDMTQALLRLLPRRSAGAATAADNARALLMSPSLTLPVQEGKLSFGTWQGVYFARHRPDARGELVFTLCEGAAQAGFTFNANKRQAHSIAAEIDRALQPQGNQNTAATRKSRKEGQGASPTSQSDDFGTLLVHEKHTSASLSLAGADLEPALREIVPERWNEEFFEHTDEGPDDMPGHMKSTLLGCSVMVPMTAGCVSLGQGQQVMINEHRDVGGFGVGHQRKVQVTQLPVSGRRVISVPTSVANAAPLTDLTAELRPALAEMGARSQGLAHIFAASPAHGVLVADAAAAEMLAAGLRSLTADERARAAIGKNGPCIPVGNDGELLLGEGQGVWLYYAGDAKKDAEAGDDALSIVISIHSSRL